MNTTIHKAVSNFVTGCVLLAGITSGADRIDRQALVTRHNIAWNEATGQIPLGNGEFCFNADGTGLQTFGGNSMSHWGWHSFPLPEGVKPLSPAFPRPFPGLRSPHEVILSKQHPKRKLLAL